MRPRLEAVKRVGQRRGPLTCVVTLLRDPVRPLTDLAASACTARRLCCFKLSVDCDAWNVVGAAEDKPRLDQLGLDRGGGPVRKESDLSLV